jgi:hypothetical protein
VVWILSVYHVCMSGGWPLTTQIKTRLVRWRRSYVRRKFPQLFNEASAVLYRSDPIRSESTLKTTLTNTIPKLVLFCRAFRVAIRQAMLATSSLRNSARGSALRPPVMK